MLHTVTRKVFYFNNSRICKLILMGLTVFIYYYISSVQKL